MYTEIDDLRKVKPGKDSDEEEDGEAFHDYETMNEHYMTIAEFSASVDDGLSFTSGKNVSVITKNPSGWWFVEMGSQEGWVPSSYLEKVFRPSPTSSKEKQPATKVTKTELSTSKPHSSKPTPPKPSPKTQLADTSPIPMVPYPSSIKPVTGSTKPKPAVIRRPSPTNRTEQKESTSVAVMASVLSKRLSSSQEITRSKPPHTRVLTKRSSDNSKLSPPTRDSFKRSSSSDAIRDIDETDQPHKTKSPPPLRPRPSEVIPPPQSRKLTQTTSSPKMGIKYLRKSTENLADIQDSSPKSTPKQIPRSATLSTASLKPDKPHPPARSSVVNAFSSQTIRLGQIEQLLIAKKPIAAIRSSPTPPPSKKGTTLTTPPKRPQFSPTKKTPPLRPYSSPAQARQKKSAYVTIADFIGTEPSSLSFNEGANVQVIEKSEEGWWYVKISGNEGWVPSTFIEKTTNQPDRPQPPRPVKRAKPLPPPVRVSSNSYRATSDYDTPVYEDSGISLVAGELYEVIERTGTGWWFVQHGSKEGWAPSSFLEPVN